MKRARRTPHGLGVLLQNRVMDIESLRNGDLGKFQKQLRIVSKKKEALLREQAEVRLGMGMST